jgi:hypothetical protein
MIERKALRRTGLWKAKSSYFDRIHTPSVRSIYLTSNLIASYCTYSASGNNALS